MSTISTYWVIRVRDIPLSPFCKYATLNNKSAKANKKKIAETFIRAVFRILARDDRARLVRKRRKKKGREIVRNSRSQVWKCVANDM